MSIKVRCVIYLLLILFVSSCKTDDGIYDSGVSQRLAQLRKEQIKHLEYSLQFCVPEQKDSVIFGNIDIDFDLASPEEVIIDFREEENIKKVFVNGDVVPYELRNEHIVIPANAFKKGGNRVAVSFVVGNQSLNRNEEFLYTLLVPDRARTVFPCFDQPDLKATFKLTLVVPEMWCAVSNSPVDSEKIGKGCKQIIFCPTEPLSTYLFSFVAGVFQKQTYDDGKYVFTAYHRETDPDRIAQLPTIFEQVSMSLAWMEEYTGIAYPFAKYDFIILPGFQYGGMEHTGATLYNDTRMFLSKNPTPDEELGRVHLIAHETAHMWFGDLVTMSWFDNVWIKEVFANYFASRIAEPLFPGINHRLNWLKSITTAALREDRTWGGTAIRQPLDNMSSAGLIYNNIIYNKAPVMLEKLVEIMGEEAFREGIHTYLDRYSYRNASWSDLVQLLDKKSDHDLNGFSDVWVNSKGMPFIDFAIHADTLVVKQGDPYERGLTWPQRFNLYLVGDSIAEMEIKMSGAITKIPLKFRPSYILPNSDGRGYGYFRYDSASLEWILQNWYHIKDETCRQAQLMNLHEAFQHGVVNADMWLASLLSGLPDEKNALIASTICSYIGMPLIETSDRTVERTLLSLAKKHELKSCRQQLLRMLISAATDRSVCQELYVIWADASHPLLHENDYMHLAYELAIRNPDLQEEIVVKQRDRIKNPDRKRQFEFIARATTPDVVEQEKLFHSLLMAENRRIEPWALKILGYLCHPLREKQAVKYIREALEALPYIQRTSDIFFPQNWTMTLLKDRYSSKAWKAVDDFLRDNKELPELLRSKILQATWNLQRRVKDK